MTGRRKVAIWAGVVVVVAGGISAAVLVLRARRSQSITLEGAVIQQDADADKELPIANVKVTITNGVVANQSESDSSGFFKLSLPEGIEPGQPAVLQFRHPGYQPLNLNIFDGNKLYIARMSPVRQPRVADYQGPQVVVSNVSVRYSVKETTVLNVGSVVKTFQVVNTGDVPCRKHKPCSPDGKWKAAIRTVSLDAPQGNEFRNARVSCIAGPCPFTRIKSRGFSRDGHSVSVSARDWSDTATFLFEAEVFHPMASNSLRVSYPVIFGRDLNFTVPATAEGVYIEADVNGSSIVFPLGPDLLLRWASCNARVNADQTRVYRCELKPGYQF